MIDIRHIKHIGQIADVVKLHKKGHEITLYKITSVDTCCWSVYIDNKKTEKRKVIFVRFMREGLIVGRVNILKGYKSEDNSWGHKRHKEPEYIDIDDLGFLKFQHFVDTRCTCKEVRNCSSWTTSDYIYKPSN
ncbi:MAG: hypothetical protein RBS24_06145 [Bacilli bacterium]|nr:hypothetical protein [Bacilli bacterium]